MGAHLSRATLLACEVAIEFWMSLSWSPQAQWLREGGGAAGPLPGELGGEAVRVCRFIIDRELEAPERFQAIQSYRAAMAVLRQQVGFVGQLWESGVVDDAERAALEAPAAARLTALELAGPTWTAPSVQEVLRALPFLQHVPQPLFVSLLEQGRLRGARGCWPLWRPSPAALAGWLAGWLDRCTTWVLTLLRAGVQATGVTCLCRLLPTLPAAEYSRGEVIWDPAHAAHSGLFVVCYGLVRSTFGDQRGGEHSVFLGSGGAIGLLSALTGEPLPSEWLLVVVCCLQLVPGLSPRDPSLPIGRRERATGGHSLTHLPPTC